MLLSRKHVLLLLLCGAHASSERSGFDDDKQESPRYEKEFITRIVGGEKVEKDTYPWFARSVTKGGGSWGGCGGSLITPEYVLTAGHCPASESSYGYQIGALCPEEDNNCGQANREYFDIKTVIPHPEYSGTSNDMKLVRLKGKSTNQPVNIDLQNIAADYNKGDPLWAIGFGALSSGGSVTDELMHVKVKYITDQECNTMYNEGGGTVDENEICAADEGKDSCQGDSGGPLYDAVNDKLVGVVSWGFGCADAKFPGVYAQIGSHIPWMLETICPNHKDPIPSFCDNWSASPTTSPAPTPAPFTCDDGKPFTLDIDFDDYPEDISWTITDTCNDNEELANSPNYTTTPSNTNLIENMCLTQDTKFLFTMNDSFGDGFAECGTSSCGYKIYYDDKKVGTMEGGFLTEGKHEFGLPSCDDKTSCEDSTDVGKLCKKLPSKKSKLRKKCSKTKEDSYVYDLCPASCNLCGDDCKDNKSKFKWKNNKKAKCKDLGKKCELPTVVINCPETCGQCMED